MQSEVMEHYGIAREFKQAEYFETEHHQSVFKQIRAAIQLGRIISVSGIVGCGKTRTLQRIQQTLINEKKILVAKSLSLEKGNVNIGSLILAIFLDLATDKEFKIPKHPERRERALRDLIRKRQQPVALFIDEAHDLLPKTLKELKRLIELIEDSGGTLSVVLAGHPKLKNDLSSAKLEEIGSRTTTIPLEGIRGHQRAYIEWLLNECKKPKVKTSEMLTDEALQYVVDRLVTALQIEHYLDLAFEEGFHMGQKPVTKEIVESVLAPDLDGLEPKLTRHGYSIKLVADMLDVRAAEIRAFLHGHLPAGRTQELQEQMLAAGLPL